MLQRIPSPTINLPKMHQYSTMGFYMITRVGVLSFLQDVLLQPLLSFLLIAAKGEGWRESRGNGVI